MHERAIFRLPFTGCTAGGMATVSSRRPTGVVPSTVQRWQERVAAWRASGLTADAFASGKAFSASTLRWWSSRLKRAPTVTFLKLLARPAAAPEPPRDLVIEVGAARVRVVSGFDPSLLAAVVRALAEGVR